MGKYIVPILSGVVGFLLASWVLVFSSAKDFVVDFGNVADWVVAFGTIGLLICAILGFFTWKNQRLPEIKSYVAKSIIEFDALMVFFLAHQLNTYEELVDYSKLIFKSFWNIEHKVSTLYMLDRSKKEQIDHILCELVNILNSMSVEIENYRKWDFTNSNPEIKERRLYKINEQYCKKCTEKTKKIFFLIVGKENTVTCNKKENGST